jgi:hypothetical protein
MQAVVLAGGLATRMRPMTLTVPKSMLEVSGRPFVDWQLEKLASSGFREVVLCVAHLGEQIRAHVGNGARYGLNVRYSFEGDVLLGTGGALRAALERLAPTFLVTYGDSYLPFDYAGPLRELDAHEDCGSSRTRRRRTTRRSTTSTTAPSPFVARWWPRSPRARPGASTFSSASSRGRGACGLTWRMTGSSKSARPRGSPR